jgi:hypothetical protein
MTTKPKNPDDFKRMAAQALRTAEQVLARIRQSIDPDKSGNEPTKSEEPAPEAPDKSDEPARDAPE